MNLLKLLYIPILMLILSCGSGKVNFFPEDEVKEELVKKEEPQVTQEPQNVILPIQKKYANILGIQPEQAKSIKLYEFIDSWMGTRYLMGGENSSGIDCSFFTQFLYHDVYGSLIERTAEKQYIAPDTDKFIGQEFLKEGDLLFFNMSGSQYERITHVGVYITNNKFVHSTSRRAENGINGVQISNLKDRHWQKLFVAAGRKSKIN